MFSWGWTHSSEMRILSIFLLLKTYFVVSEEVEVIILMCLEHDQNYVVVSFWYAAKLAWFVSRSQELRRLRCWLLIEYHLAYHSVNLGWDVVGLCRWWITCLSAVPFTLSIAHFPSRNEKIKPWHKTESARECLWHCRMWVPKSEASSLSVRALEKCGKQQD